MYIRPPPCPPFRYRRSDDAKHLHHPCPRYIHLNRQKKTPYFSFLPSRGGRCFSTAGSEGHGRYCEGGTQGRRTRQPPAKKKKKEPMFLLGQQYSIISVWRVVVRWCGVVCAEFVNLRELEPQRKKIQNTHTHTRA